MLLAKWIVRNVPLEIVGSSRHEKVPTREKPGLERPGRPRGERIEGSHLAEANLKYKRPFRALPVTSATAFTAVPSQINVECRRLAKGFV
ncbi:hypothetical protein TNCV_4446821 [Trichonephila clavipes]|nr:hypothetical protein TNCV_4446821 [Trichonephila clavipes]